ncbi:MAG TPA: MATE family efflux transporter [Synergistetes bacterium]|nr:MATE family efflux transporter [Synergistota bacterium]
MAILHRNVDMGSGSVPGTIWRLALPSILSMLFHTLFHLVDTIFIAWLGESSLAAMSLTFPLVFIIFALVNGMAVGATTRMSQSLGGNRDKDARNYADAALILVLILSTPTLPLLVRPFSDLFFSFLGGSGQVLPDSYSYAFWMVLATPLMSYSLLADSVFRSQGDTVTPMKSMILGNGINILLDPLFIFTFGWGIAGASIATLIGRLASCVYLWSRLRKRSSIRPAFSWDKGHPTRWMDISRIGLPVAISQGSMSIGAAMLNKILSGFGPAAVGAWMLGNRVEMLVFLPVFGFNGAVIPFVGYNLGKGDYGRIRESLRVVLLSSFAMISIVGTFVYLCPEMVLALFKPTDQVMSMASASIRASATAYILAAADISFWGFFQGSGYPVYGMVAQIIRTLAVRVPAALLLSATFGLAGIWWCQPISAAASFMVSTYFIFVVMKRIKQDVESRKVVNLDS